MADYVKTLDAAVEDQLLVDTAAGKTKVYTLATLPDPTTREVDHYFWMMGL